MSARNIIIMLLVLSVILTIVLPITLCYKQKADEVLWKEKNFQIPETVVSALEIYRAYGYTNMDVVLNEGTPDETNYYAEDPYYYNIAKGFKLGIQLRGTKKDGNTESVLLVLYKWNGMYWEEKDLVPLGSYNFHSTSGSSTWNYQKYNITLNYHYNRKPHRVTFSGTMK